MKYYIQNVERGFVGNSLLWWKQNNCGYTPDLKEAKIFSQIDAETTVTQGCKKFIAWPKEYIDSKIQHHIDMQTVELCMCDAIKADCYDLIYLYF